MVLIRINKKVQFIIVVVIMLFSITGLMYSYRENRTIMEKNKVLIENNSQLQEKLNEAEKKNLDNVISNYIKNEVYKVTGPCDIKFVAHMILGMEEIETKLYFYLYARVSGYKIKSGGLEFSTGGSSPVLIVLKRNYDGYMVLFCKKTGHGADYAPSIKAMFPPKYAKRAINDHISISKELENDIKNQVEGWLNVATLNRTT